MRPDLQPNVRPAEPADVPAMTALIQELAEFHGHRDEVEARDEDLHAALFTTNPTTFAHVAELDGTVVAVAIWYIGYSTWTGRNSLYLEDIVVSSDVRSGGIGRAIMAELRRIAVERGYRRIDWQVWDGNDRGKNFYRSIGAEPVPSQQLWRLAL
jgi:ribosomal protein S18 acetylase RimI-like enzyme